MRRRIGKRDGPGTRHCEYREPNIAKGICQRREQLNLRLLGPRGNVAITQAGTRTIVAHHTKAFRQASEEPTKSWMLPIALHMADPPCRADDERPLTDYRIGNPRAACVSKESNGLHRWHSFFQEFSFDFHDNLMVCASTVRRARLSHDGPGNGSQCICVRFPNWAIEWRSAHDDGYECDGYRHDAGSSDLSPQHFRLRPAGECSIHQVSALLTQFRPRAADLAVRGHCRHA